MWLLKLHRAVAQLLIQNSAATIPDYEPKFEIAFSLKGPFLGNLPAKTFESVRHKPLRSSCDWVFSAEDSLRNYIFDMVTRDVREALDQDYPVRFCYSEIGPRIYLLDPNLEWEDAVSRLNKKTDTQPLLFSVRMAAVHSIALFDSLAAEAFGTKP